MDAALIFDKPVTGKHFFGRRTELQSMLRCLQERKNIVLYAPPGTGCHSLLEQSLADYMKGGAEFVAVRVNLMGVRSLEGFRLEMQRALGRHSAGRQLIVCIDEFQDLMLMDDAGGACRFMQGLLEEQQADDSAVSYVLIGSRFNAMREPFERSSMFSPYVQRVDLLPFNGPDFIHSVNMAFLGTGKVIENDPFLEHWELLGQNPYYFTCFAAMCDSLSRGYITPQVMENALGLLLSLHRPRFKAVMADLTVYQVRLLKALFEGHERFSAAEVITGYGLNSSANVHRVKEALCKKEILTFDENDAPAFIDPLFRYWAAKEYFHTA